MKNLDSDPEFELQVMVTGMHLSPEFGMTVRAVEEDGFQITARIETLMSSDTGIGVAKSLGIGIIGFADAFQSFRPDAIILLGDRFEIFAAAQAALFTAIPVVHIGGGDITEGAYDDPMRHAISKLSHMHFVTNGDAYLRLLRMGEDPKRVFNFGSPGLDYLDQTKIIEKNVLEEKLSFEFQKINFLITFHPVTLDKVSSLDQLNELLEALDSYGNDAGLIFTFPNADNQGRKIKSRLEGFVKSKKNAKLYSSLGINQYLSAMKYVNAVVGNSSSGLYEAPSLRTPTVNIGIRQKGRIKAKSVFDCDAKKNEIIKSINQAISFGNQKVINPYHVGNFASLAVGELKKIKDFSCLGVKKFNDSLDL